MSFFFFNDTATTEIYTLSLHDALPIWALGGGMVAWRSCTTTCDPAFASRAAAPSWRSHRSRAQPARSEEHTSELQSQSNLVCRLLLEKKKEHEVQTSRVDTIESDFATL